MAIRATKAQMDGYRSIKTKSRTDGRGIVFFRAPSGRTLWTDTYVVHEVPETLLNDESVEVPIDTALDVQISKGFIPAKDYRGPKPELVADAAFRRIATALKTEPREITFPGERGDNGAGIEVLVADDGTLVDARDEDVIEKAERVTVSRTGLVLYWNRNDEIDPWQPEKLYVIGATRTTKEVKARAMEFSEVAWSHERPYSFHLSNPRAVSGVECSARRATGYATGKLRDALSLGLTPCVDCFRTDEETEKRRQYTRQRTIDQRKNNLTTASSRRKA